MSFLQHHPRKATASVVFPSPPDVTVSHTRPTHGWLGPVATLRRSLCGRTGAKGQHGGFSTIWTGRHVYKRKAGELCWSKPCLKRPRGRESGE